MSIITLTGPTCAGKSTVERELQKLGCGRAISHTTRAPRSGEVDGTDYHFISDAEYDRMKVAGEFIETIEFGTKRYALAAKSLDTAYLNNTHVVIVVEPVGASQILAYCQNKGLRKLAVWLDCNPVEQARRWVTRMAGDMIVGKEAVGAYAERLGIMLTQEVQWREAAYYGRLWKSSGWTYNLMLHNTEQRDPKETARLILLQLW